MKDFLTTTQTHPPHIPLPYYLLMLLAMVLLSYLSWLWHNNTIWRWTFITLQAIQLISLYIWYIWQGFPLDDSLPLYHCRMAMLALLLLKDSKVKTYFALMGLVGGCCAIIYPVFDPYNFPHISSISFIIGHYALLVNSLNYLLRTYKTHPISKNMIVTLTLLLNLGLVVVNHFVSGNYGLLRHTPFIPDAWLPIKYLAVSVTLIILMIIMKKGLEYFDEKY